MEELAGSRYSPDSRNVARGNYYLRKDVISKSIFRAVRKFHFENFKTHFQILKSNDVRAMTFHEDFGSYVNQYVREKFTCANMDIMKILFTAFMNPKVPCVDTTPEEKHIRGLVLQLLHKFKTKWVEELVAYPEFLCLLGDFLSQPDVLSRIKNATLNENARRAYSKQVKVLRNVCESDSSAVAKVLLTFL